MGRKVLPGSLPTTPTHRLAAMQLPEIFGSQPSRRIPLEGALNFRDLGGYPTVDGRRVRWRRVFRSDSLGPMSEADARHLVDEIGLATIIDLRSTREVEKEGRGPLAEAAIGYHHLPLFEVVPGHKRVWPASLSELYRGMLRDAAGQVVRVLDVVAAADAHPVVFHCVAGKDRTGVVAAVLLGILGVGDDDIVADYVMTQEVMPAMRARWDASAGPDLKELPQHILQAEADTMRQLLAVLRDDHGSVIDYARDSGLRDHVVAELRRALLAPPS